MNSIKTFFSLLLLLVTFRASAIDVTETLRSAKHDKVIVTYSITKKDNRVDLQFKSVKKQLGDYHRDKYKKDVEKIQTFFFDWVGVRKDMKFTGETPSAICFPANASYKKSSDGYFIVEQKPSLSFDLATDEAKTFTIPVYLAHYEGTRCYKILCFCGNLEVNLPGETSSPSTQPAMKPGLEQNEFDALQNEEELSEFDDQALNLIKSINKSLPYQDTLPMESTLERKIENLVDLQSKIKNEDIIKMIDETIDDYNSKKKELERAIAESNKQKADDNAFATCNSKEDYEIYMKQYPNGSHVEAAKSKVAELDDKAKKDDDDRKKRNIWMIIGGVLLAILLFVGNQVLQSFRNIRTQRSMMQMQQDATNRAQNMARSKAKSEIRKQTTKATGQVKKKGQSIIRGTTDKVKNNNGNNRVSI